MSLYEVLGAKRWNDVPQFISEARITRENNYTALSMAIYCEAPLSVIKLLIEAYPEAAYKMTFGFIPLTVAFVKKLPEETLMYIIEAVPESIWFPRENNSTTPLRSALITLQSKRVIKALIDIDPLALDHRDRTGNTPLRSFFVVLYVFIQNLLAKISNDWKKQDILNLEIDSHDEVNDIQYIFDILEMLLGQATEERILEEAIVNPDIPWNWCEFLLHTHPNQAENLIPLALSTCAACKSAAYEKIFICRSCKYVPKKGELAWLGESTMCVGRNLCKGCYKVQNDEFNFNCMERDEERDKISFIYKLIRENPAFAQCCI